MSSFEDREPAATTTTVTLTASEKPSAEIANEPTAPVSSTTTKDKKENNTHLSSSFASTTSHVVRPKWWTESDMLSKAYGVAYYSGYKLSTVIMKQRDIHSAVRACDKLLHFRKDGEELKSSDAPPDLTLLPEDSLETTTKTRGTTTKENGKSKSKKDTKDKDLLLPLSPDDRNNEDEFYPSYCGFPFVFSEQKEQPTTNESKNDDQDQLQRAPSSTANTTGQKIEVDEEKFFKAWHSTSNAWSTPENLLHRRPKKKQIPAQLLFDQGITAKEVNNKNAAAAVVSSQFPAEIPATSPMAQKKRVRFSQADILRPWHRVSVIDDLPFEAEFILNAQPHGFESFITTTKSQKDDETTNNNKLLNNNNNSSLSLLAQNIPTTSLMLHDEDPTLYDKQESQQRFASVTDRYGFKLWEKMMERVREHNNKCNNNNNPSDLPIDIPTVYPENPKVPILPGSFQDLTLLQRLHQIRLSCGDVYQHQEIVEEQRKSPKALLYLAEQQQQPKNSNHQQNHEPFGDDNDNNQEESANTNNNNNKKSSPNASTNLATSISVLEAKPDNLAPDLTDQHIFSLARLFRRCAKFHHEILQPGQIKELAVTIVRFAGELFKSGVVPLSEVSHDAFALPYNQDRQCCIEQIRFKTFSVVDEQKDIHIRLEDAPSDFLKLQVTRLRAISEPFRVIVKKSSALVCSHSNPACRMFTKFVMKPNSPNNSNNNNNNNNNNSDKNNNTSSEPTTKTSTVKTAAKNLAASLLNNTLASTIAATGESEFVEYDVDMSDEDDAGSLDQAVNSPKKSLNFVNTTNSVKKSATENKSDDETKTNGGEQQKKKQQQQETKNNDDDDDDEEPIEISVEVKLKEVDVSAAFDVRHVYGTAGSAMPVVRDVEVRLRHFALVVDVKNSVFKSLFAKLLCGAFRPLIRTAIENGIKSAVEKMAPSPEELEKLKKEFLQKQKKRGGGGGGGGENGNNSPSTSDDEREREEQRGKFSTFVNDGNDDDDNQSGTTSDDIIGVNANNVTINL